MTICMFILETTAAVSNVVSGVINVVSRHEGTAPDGAHSLLRSTLGNTATRYGTGNAAFQDHALTMRTGTNLRSGGITIGGATAGQYIPDAYSREFRTLADARVVGTRISFTGSGRYFAKSAGVPENPLLAVVTGNEIESDDDPQQLRMYAAGGTVTWTHDGTQPHTVTAPDGTFDSGTLESGEVCDGANLGGQSCQGLGYQSGTLSCAAGCGSFVEIGGQYRAGCGRSKSARAR